MKKLALPEPARRLWLATRDILTNLGSPGKPWVVHLGGGTIIAARVRHRESTDIDIMVRNTDRLTMLTLNDDQNLARRLGGSPKREAESQIKIKLADGVIDINTIAVRPKTGAERVEIDDRPQHVLSTTQILRGKLDRATDPAPVRDVYDVIRLSRDQRFEAELAAAYGLISSETQDSIEKAWSRLDDDYERQAAKHLRLTENPCCDLARLGSTGASVLNGYRLARVVIELDQNSVLTERSTRNGKCFHDLSHPSTTRSLHDRTGLGPVLEASGLDSRSISRRITMCQAQGLNGVIFDSADPRPLDRFTGKNASMRRHEAPPTLAGIKLEPPSPELSAGARIDHSRDTSATRSKNAPVGGKRPATRRGPKKPGDSEDQPGGPKR